MLLTKVARYKNLVAILAGSAAVSIVFCLYNAVFSPDIILYVFIIALIVSVWLGLPLYAALPDKLRARWSTPFIAGFLSGTVPYFLFNYYVPENSSVSYDGIIYRENGVRTPAGWILFYQSVFLMGALGITGAMTTWFVWMFFRKHLSQYSHNP